MMNARFPPRINQRPTRHFFTALIRAPPSSVLRPSRRRSTPDHGSTASTQQDSDIAFSSTASSSSATSAWSTWQLLTQLWAVILPLGYAGVPLAAQATGQPSLAAAAIETVVLAAVWTILTRKKGLAFKINFLDSKALGLGVFAAAAALTINQLLFGASGEPSSSAEAVAAAAGGSTIAAVAQAAASAVLAPATEELVYRGFLLDALLRLGAPAPAAVAMSALAFAAAHLDPAAVPQLIIVGTALGSAFVAAEGNLVAPFVGHAIYNAALLSSLLRS